MIDGTVDANAALTFSLAAPFIVLLIGVAKSAYPLPGKFIPLITLAVSFVWGGILWASGYWDGNPALFVVQGIIVSTAANGMQGIFRQVVPVE